MLRFAYAMICLFHAAAAQAAEFDRIYFNGAIITQDDTRPRAQAMLVSGGKIISAGQNGETLQNITAETQLIDLGGRTVIPGLIDSHIHAIRAGLTYSTEVSWIDIPDLETGLRRITDAAQRGNGWIITAGGWNIQQFAGQRRPELADIERAAPGRAVYIQLAYNSVLISREGLRLLDISAESDLPAGAKFELTKEGARTGWITGNGPFMIAFFDRLPKFDKEKNIEGTKQFFNRLNQYGITGVIDPGGHNLKQAEYAALFEMAKRDALTLRVAFSAFAPRAGHERADFERLINEYSRQNHPLLRFNGLGEAITWGFYNNHDPSEEQKREFESLALWAAAQKHRLTIHWNNDASVHHVLDVFERINAQHPLKNLRWSIAHLHDGSRATIQRMQRLGLGWLVQNAGYFAAPAYLRARGEAVRESPPLASALRMGMPVGGGTDAHRVMSYNPFLSLRWMIDGVTAGGLSTREPDERLSREEALRIYTSGSAWFTGDGDSRGRIMPGYEADFAVLDRDYLSAPLKEFGQMKSLLTVVAGRIVHTAGPFARYSGVLTPANASTDLAPGR